MFVTETYFHNSILSPGREVAEFWRCVNLAATLLIWVQNTRRIWLDEVKKHPHQEEEEKGQLINEAQRYQGANTFIWEKRTLGYSMLCGEK